MTKVSDVFNFLEQKMPLKFKMDFDNAGLLVGERSSKVDAILVTLDITDEVISEAETMGASLIVSHHPVIFSPVKNVTDGDIAGQKIMKLIKSGIAAICMHTNLDAVTGGVNDALAAKLGLTDTKIIDCGGIDEKHGEYGIGRYGNLNTPVDFGEFLKNVKMSLGTDGLRYFSAGKTVFKLAVGGGSCGDYLKTAAALGCDTFVTSDIKHSTFIEAREYGINLIDAGHFYTENVICKPLSEMIKREFPEITVKVSEVNTAPMKFFV